MNNFLQDVAEFQTTFGHPVLVEPTVIDPKRFAFRVSLIEEELKELKEAQEAGDLVGIADAFCDIKYVLNGFILETGFQNILDDAFAEVHRSNMSKSCATKEDAIATCNNILEANGWECYYEQIGDVYVVKRLSDDKAMKSIYYTKPDLEQFFK